MTFYLFIYLISLVIQIIFAGTTKQVWLMGLRALPLVILGLILGQIIFRYINQLLFRYVTYVLLLFTALYLLWHN